MSSKKPITELLLSEDRKICIGREANRECNVLPDLAKGTELSYDEKLRAAELAAKLGGAEFTYQSTEAFFPLGCVACHKMCLAVYTKINGQRTEDPPGISSMDPEAYDIRYLDSFRILTRELLNSIDPNKKDKITSKEPDHAILPTT